MTFKVMPVSPDVDMAQLKNDVTKKANQVGGKFISSVEEPIAFGLKALMCRIEWPETKDPEILEADLNKVKNVKSIQVTDMRRLIA